MWSLTCVPVNVYNTLYKFKPLLKAAPRAIPQPPVTSENIAKNAKVADIRKITANTPERFNAYAQYNEMLDGKVFRLPKGDTCETL